MAINYFASSVDIEKKDQNKAVFLPYSILQSDVESQINYFVIRRKLSNLQCKSSKIK